VTTIVPPEPGTDPRDAVPFAGTPPRLRPPLGLNDPLSPELELDPLELDPPEDPDEPLDDPPPPPDGDAVPTAGAPPLLVCCAHAAAGSVKQTMNTVEDRCRVIGFAYATRLPMNGPRKPRLSSHKRPHFLTPFRGDR